MSEQENSRSPQSALLVGAGDEATEQVPEPLGAESCTSTSISINGDAGMGNNVFSSPEKLDKAEGSKEESAASRIKVGCEGQKEECKETPSAMLRPEEVIVPGKESKVPRDSASPGAEPDMGVSEGDEARETSGVSNGLDGEGVNGDWRGCDGGEGCKDGPVVRKDGEVMNQGCEGKETPMNEENGRSDEDERSINVGKAKNEDNKKMSETKKGKNDKSYENKGKSENGTSDKNKETFVNEEETVTNEEKKATSDTEKEDIVTSDEEKKETSETQNSITGEDKSTVQETIKEQNHASELNTEPSRALASKEPCDRLENKSEPVEGKVTNGIAEEHPLPLSKEPECVIPLLAQNGLEVREDAREVENLVVYPTRDTDSEAGDSVCSEDGEHGEVCRGGGNCPHQEADAGWEYVVDEEFNVPRRPVFNGASDHLERRSSLKRRASEESEGKYIDCYLFVVFMTYFLPSLLVCVTLAFVYGSLL